jgi:hypothetical protein
MRTCDFKTLSFTPLRGTYRVTKDRKLVLVPHRGGEIGPQNYSGTIRIWTADGKSETYLLTFENGLLTKNPRLELDAG